MSDEPSDLKALRDFVLDIDCLAPLEEPANDANVFSILGITRKEIYHSAMIAWLLDPSQPHGLGSALAEEIIRESAKRQGMGEIERCRLLMADVSDLVVRREWRNIDIMAYSERDKVVICIENKVDTGEHDDQLARYKRVVNKAYRDYHAIFIYLTPCGSESSDPSAWMSVGYEFLLRFLESRTHSEVAAGENARSLLRQYAETIERSIVKNDEVARLCNDIYKRHRKALDLIYENKYDALAELGSRISEWLGGHGKTLSLQTKGYVRFRSEQLDGLLGSWPDGKGNFKDGSLAVFGFDFTGEVARPYFTFNCDRRKELMGKARAFRNALQEEWAYKKGSWKCDHWIDVGTWETDELLFGEGELERFMEKSMEAVDAFERELVAKFNGLE